MKKAYLRTAALGGLLLACVSWLAGTPGQAEVAGAVMPTQHHAHQVTMLGGSDALSPAGREHLIAARRLVALARLETDPVAKDERLVEALELTLRTIEEVLYADPAVRDGHHHAGGHHAAAAGGGCGY